MEKVMTCLKRMRVLQASTRAAPAPLCLFAFQRPPFLLQGETLGEVQAHVHVHAAVAALLVERHVLGLAIQDHLRRGSKLRYV